MKKPSLDLSAITEDTSKIGVLVMVAALIGFFISDNNPSDNDASAVTLFITGMIIWVGGVLFTRPS